MPLNDLSADGQTQPSAVRHVRVRISKGDELLKDAALVLGGNPASSVIYRHLDPVTIVVASYAQIYRHATFIRKLCGVSKKIGKDLGDALGVGHHDMRALVLEDKSDLHVVSKQRGAGLERFGTNVRQVHCLRMHAHAGRLEFREIQDVVDDPGESDTL